MKFKVKYGDFNSFSGWSNLRFSEIIEAPDITKAYEIAKTHAKSLSKDVHSVVEIKC